MRGSFVKARVWSLALALSGGVMAAEPVDVGDFDPSGRVRMQMAGDKKQSTVFIPSYRVAFQIAGKATASTRGGFSLGGSRSATRATTDTALDGVDFALMQSIADRAHQDLVARLQAAGFTVLTDEQWRAAPSAAKLEWGEASSAEKSVTREGKTGSIDTAFVIVVPPGMQNWPESVMPANLGASRSLRRELEATMVVPRLVVNYVALSSSGRGKSGVFSRGSEVTARPLIHGGAYAAGFGFDNWRVRLGQHGGFMEFKPDGVIEAPGDFATVDESEVDVSGANTANAISWALAGVGTFSEANFLRYKANPEAYASLALQALARQNAVLVHELGNAR
jgi:hypothetical protein